ncbi:hypothetical protein LOD99_9577 [Oopsacas minuta]|uniref:EGF-like domain-containing protein n=1 Tax=Oopsacas minuta TaxID=111878 RepID=A0AAV7KND7_9METZ|nr:hypothetical protein LOD99_9577 [Oopsacas minuta]
MQESLQNCSQRDELILTIEANITGVITIDLTNITYSLVQLWIIVLENSIVMLDIESVPVNMTALTLAGGGTIKLQNQQDIDGTGKLTFFQYFENISRLIFIARFQFSFSPSFTKLKSLRILIIVVLEGLNSDTGFGGVLCLDSSVVSGLGSLEYFSWIGGNIGKITSNAFEGTNRIRYLNLSHNRIKIIESKALDPLTEVEDIDFNRNIIQYVTPPVFYASINLENLRLSNNPFFPLEALAGTHASTIFLDNNGYETLRAVDFVSIVARPVVISLTELLNCDCSLQWTSGVTQFGITFNDAICIEPISNIGREIQLASYDSCNSNQTFECFGQDGACLDGLSCIIQSTGSRCGCLVGYSYNSQELVCEDINECELNGTNTCGHSCYNTLGSFSCSCDSGYEIGLNGRDCVDINECLVLNGGCGYACINTDGGHDCVCENGAIVNEMEECMELSIMMRPGFIWGLVVSIILAIVIVLCGITISVYLIFLCYKRSKNRNDKVIEKSVKNATNQSNTQGIYYENENVDPNFEPYAVVVRNKTNRDKQNTIETNKDKQNTIETNRTLSVNSGTTEERKYYVI